jgi:hypothetical protein
LPRRGGPSCHTDYATALHSRVFAERKISETEATANHIQLTVCDKHFIGALSQPSTQFEPFAVIAFIGPEVLENGIFCIIFPACRSQILMRSLIRKEVPSALNKPLCRLFQFWIDKVLIGVTPPIDKI